MCYSPHMVTITREEYDWLCTTSISPIDTATPQAKAMLNSWGHDPKQLPDELVQAMGQEMGEAILDAAIDFMRDHGLANLDAGEVPPDRTGGA